MKEIEINGFIVLVDDEDYERVVQHSWSVYRSGHTYYVRNNKTGQSLHRFIMNAPKGSELDHRNGNALDNGKENLRFCTQLENIRNSRPQGECKYKGVYRRGNSWGTAICVKKFWYSLGTYPTPEQAALEYDDAAEGYFGEFAWLNRDHFPELAYTKKELEYHPAESTNTVNFDELMKLIDSVDLTDRENAFVIARLQAKSLQKIGKEAGISKERTRQILARIIRKIQTYARLNDITACEFVEN